MAKRAEQPTFHEQWDAPAEEPAETRKEPFRKANEDEDCAYCGGGPGGCRYCSFGKRKK